jgi:2-aminoethylphosphonate dioxygenase
MSEAAALADRDLAAPLSAADCAAYATAGWVLARGFISPDEVAMLARWSDELLALPERPGAHMVYYEEGPNEGGPRLVQRIENFCPYHAGFDEFIRFGRLHRAVEQVAGAAMCLFKEKINFKLPGGAGFEPHQDQQAGWSRYAPWFVTALVSIDRATIENGCLEMADVPRLSRLVGPEWEPLRPADMQGFTLRPVPTEPGDVLFFDSYAPHASKSNLTRSSRRILYLTYNAAAAGDHRMRYFAEKRANFPPDAERRAGTAYKFRV